MKNNLKERVRVLIGAMGDDEFERFVSELLPRVDSEFKNLEPTFNFIGKATKGKCDGYVYHSEDDRYTAIICTTQQSAIRSKIIDDINKLTATRFSAKIKNVLLCINTPIKDEVEEFRDICSEKGWGFNPFSLEKITNIILNESDLLRKYFQEVQEESTSTIGGSSLRRFDCGPRLKEAREDVSLSISRIIENIDFPSEKEWKSVEDGVLEVTEKYIDKISILTGVSVNWLKHNEDGKYLIERIYVDQYYRIGDLQMGLPSISYILIEPKNMNVILVSRISEFHWKVFSMGSSMNFWDWIGDEHYIPVTYKMLVLINKKMKSPYSKVVSKEIMNEFYSEKTHPAKILEKAGGNSYWFDDLFDLYHRYPIAKDQYRFHGDWFVKLQAEFRNYISKEMNDSLKNEY